MEVTGSWSKVTEDGGQRWPAVVIEDYHQKFVEKQSLQMEVEGDRPWSFKNDDRRLAKMIVGDYWKTIVRSRLATVMESQFCQQLLEKNHRRLANNNCQEGDHLEVGRLWSLDNSNQRLIGGDRRKILVRGLPMTITGKQ